MPNRHPESNPRAARCGVQLRSAPSIDPDAFWSALVRAHGAPSRSENVLNACVVALDRQLAADGDAVAVRCGSDDPALAWHASYRDLHAEVCRLGNALRHLGIVRGDRVAIRLPAIREAAVAMLACARIGAVHVALPPTDHAAVLAACIADAGCRLVVTADAVMCDGNRVPLKAIIDDASVRPGTRDVETVIIVRHAGCACLIRPPRDRWYHDLVTGQSVECPPEPMRARDPLFIAYAIDAEGKPEGTPHALGAYVT